MELIRGLENLVRVCLTSGIVSFDQFVANELFLARVQRLMNRDEELKDRRVALLCSHMEYSY